MLKWGFVLVTAYTGVVGAFLYVLGCREPLPGLHEQYVAARWRQTLGSTMHCVAGDGVGILAGAVLGGLMTRAEGDVAGHLATVGRLAAAGEDSTAARAGLGLAEHGLALLRGRQRFLRSGDRRSTAVNSTP